MTATVALPANDTTETGLIGWAERGLVPDAALRAGIRRLCAQRLHEETRGGIEAQSARFRQRIAELEGQTREAAAWRDALVARLPDPSTPPRRRWWPWGNR